MSPHVRIIRVPAGVILSVFAALVACAAPEPEQDGSIARGIEVFTWSVEEKAKRFREMESLAPASVVENGSEPSALPRGRPLAALEEGEGAARVARFMEDQYVSGLLVLHQGQIRLERYALGHGPEERWTSFSVAKSITSTLVGAAIRDGHIGGLDDDVTQYITDLRDTAYDGVTVRQLLTMTSGVAFNEDYGDPDSDIMRLYSQPPPQGVDANVAYVRDLEREAEPGTVWRYKTPETHLAGLLVMEATGKSLAEYLAETIWQPVGMEMSATWLVDAIGNEQGGCCLQASLRDYARFGQFILAGGTIDGEPVLPDGWLEDATTEQAATGMPGGYGYQWWPLGDGTFQARGIFGQLIHLDPARELVIVISAAWPEPNARARRVAQFAFAREIAAAIDAESAAVN